MLENEMYRVMFQLGFFMLVVEAGLKAFFSLKAYDKFITNGTPGLYVSKPLFAVAVSLLLCWRMNFDILSLVMGTEFTYIGMVLTGLTVSRGSNGLADFLARHKELKAAISKAKVETVIKNGNVNK